jgi:hypothetical protein
VPTVSKKSTSTSENSSGASFQSRAVCRSAWNSVSKRGQATTAPDHAMWPVASANSAETAMANSMAPARLRASSTAPSATPMPAMSGSADAQSPPVTGGIVSPGAAESAATVDAGTTTIRAWTSPRNTMNRPMPAPMARRRSTGIARMTASRTPRSTRSSTMAPSSTTRPIAACQLPAAGAAWNAMTAFRPMPGASAMGTLAPRPIRIEATAAVSAVAATAASAGTPAADRIAGLATRM